MENFDARVIQGSVIGPILFIIFIADINQYLPEDICLEKYADEILAYVTRNIDTLPQEIADGVNKWCKDNQMRLNITKFMVIHIGDKLKATVKIDGTTLEIVEQYKYLSIMINSRLNWEEHWYKVQKTISSLPYLLCTLKRDGFREEILVNVYRSYELSHITYSAPVLSSTIASVKEEMESFQLRCLRIININSPFDRVQTYHH